VLPTDAILMRLSLAVLAGLVASLLTSSRVALIVGVAVFYALLVLFRKPKRPTWPE